MMNANDISSGARVVQIYIHKMTFVDGKAEVTLSFKQKLLAALGLGPTKEELENTMTRMLLGKDINEENNK